MGTKAQIDETGWRILTELQANARLSFTELGRRVGLTAPAVAERVHRLEEAGVIAGYRIELDHERLGLPLLAFVRLRSRGGTCAEFADVAAGLPEIQEAHRITGTESYVLKAAVRDVRHLEDLIDRLMPWGETTTSVVLSSPVTRRVLGPELVRDPTPGDDATDQRDSA